MSDTKITTIDENDLEAARKRAMVNHSDAVDDGALLQVFRGTRQDAYDLTAEDMRRDNK